MKGKDGQLHSLECEAESLFSAADQAITEWNRRWWFTSDAVLEIRAGDEKWRVNQERVRERRNAIKSKLKGFV
jgi:hypothetical protein